jgi:NAD-dependent deacetylase
MKKKLVVLTELELVQKVEFQLFEMPTVCGKIMILWKSLRLMVIKEILNWFKNSTTNENNYSKLNPILRIFLKELEHDFDVSIITQNVDDLHERAG